MKFRLLGFVKSDPCKGGIYLLYPLQEVLFCTVTGLINLLLKMFNGHLVVYAATFFKPGATSRLVRINGSASRGVFFIGIAPYNPRKKEAFP